MKKNILFLTVVFYAGLYGTALKSSFFSENTFKASSLYTERGTIELKNYLKYPYYVQILDEENKPLLTDQLYMVPAAKGSKQEELGYLRMVQEVRPKDDITKKRITILLYRGWNSKPAEQEKIKKGNTKDLFAYGKFVISPDPKRERILVSVESSKDPAIKNNEVALTMRPESSAWKGLKSETVSGIPIKNNVKKDDIKAR